MRLTAPVLVLTGLFFAGCSGSSTSNPNGGGDGGNTCQTFRDCATNDPAQCASPKVCVCSNSVCVPVCQSDADCTIPGQVCNGGTCSTPIAGCGDDMDCGDGGTICIGGSCQPAPQASQIQSCVISPASADVHTNDTVQLAAVAQDGSGNALPYNGVQWTISGSVATISSTGLVTGGAAPAGSSQQVTATATIPATPAITCTAIVNVYGAVTQNNALRVVVIDEDTKAPISGAFVALDTASNKQTTGADGSATFTLQAASGTHNVHAFAANHDYASYIGVSGTDLLIPLRQFYPIAERSAFDGSISVSDFANLTEVGEIAHLAFFGSGISGSLLDFTLDDFIGQTRTVDVNLTGTPYTLPGVPGGLVLGLANDLYTGDVDGGTGAMTSSYSMYADPGRRILWGIGGNLDINTIISVAGPIISGGSSGLNIGTLLPEVLPLLGNLEVGEVVGVQAGQSDSDGGTPAPTNLSVTLDTPMAMNVAIKAPDLPQFNGSYVDGVIAVTGGAAFPLGFSPLGLTAGLAATNTEADGGVVKTGAILDPTCTPTEADGGTVNCATNNLPLHMAARNHGLESYPYGLVLVALNFGALTSSSNSAIAISGKVQTQNDIAFSGGSTPATVVDMSTTPFMKLPGSTSSVSYSVSANTLTISSDADPSTQIYKFTLQDATHQTWSVYLPPAGANGSTATLINPTDVSPTLNDINTDTGTSGWISAIATTSASNNYASLTGFGDVTVDALGNNLQNFAVQTVTLGQ